MALDLAGILFIIVSFIIGYRKNFIIAAFSVIAILLGIICALKLSHTLASFLLQKHIITSGWGQIISFILLFIGVVLLVRFIAKAIEKILKMALLGVINKLVGGILYAFLGAVVWSIFLWLFNQMHLISPEKIAASKTYPWFAPLAPWFFDHVGILWSFAKNLFSDLQHFFDSVNQKLPDHVGTAR